MPTPQGVDHPLDGAVTDVEEKVELLGKRQIPSSVGRSKLVLSRSPGVELTFKVAVLISGKKDQAADLGSFTPELHRFFLRVRKVLHRHQRPACVVAAEEVGVPADRLTVSMDFIRNSLVDRRGAPRGQDVFKVVTIAVPR